MDIQQSPYLTDFLNLHLSTYPSISLSFHHRSFALEMLTNQKRRLPLTLKGIPMELSTAHHGAGKLSILLVSTWFENKQHFMVAWRRRPLICVPVQSLFYTFTVLFAYGIYLRRDFAIFSPTLYQIKSFQLFFLQTYWFFFECLPFCNSISQLPAKSAQLH